MARAGSLRDGSTLGLLLALALAVAAGLLVFVAVRSGGGDDPPPQVPAQTVAMADVVRVVEDIPARAEITAEMLEVVRIPRTAILPGAFTSVEPLVGQTTRMPIFVGEQITPRKVIAVPVATVRSLSFIVPEGKRALAINVNKVATAGGLLKPGDRIDVIVLLSVEDENRTITIAQNIEVLAVEQALQRRMSTEVAVSDGTLIDQPDIQPDASVITLALTPREAQEFFLADSIGTIRLAVRGSGDEGTEVLGPSNLQSLLDPELEAFIESLLALVDPEMQDIIREALETLIAEAAASAAAE